MEALIGKLIDSNNVVEYDAEIKENIDKYNLHVFLLVEKKCSVYYRIAPQKIRVRKELAQLAISQNIQNYNHIPQQFKHDIDIVRLLMFANPNYYANYLMSKGILITDLALARYLVSMRTDYYILCSHEVKSDPVIMKEASSDALWVINKIQQQYKCKINDVEFAKVAIKSSPHNYKFLSPELKGDINLAMISLESKNDMYYPDFYPTEILNNQKFVMKARHHLPTTFNVLPLKDHCNYDILMDMFLSMMRVKKIKISHYIEDSISYVDIYINDNVKYTMIPSKYCCQTNIVENSIKLLTSLKKSRTGHKKNMMYQNDFDLKLNYDVSSKVRNI